MHYQEELFADSRQDSFENAFSTFAADHPDELALLVIAKALGNQTVSEPLEESLLDAAASYASTAEWEHDSGEVFDAALPSLKAALDWTVCRLTNPSIGGAL